MCALEGREHGPGEPGLWPSDSWHWASAIRKPLANMKEISCAAANPILRPVSRYPSTAGTPLPGLGILRLA